MVWYGVVIGLMVGRGRLPLALPSSSLLPPAKEFLLLQFLICCIVQDPQGRRMAVDIISARILSKQILLPASCQEFAAQEPSTYNIDLFSNTSPSLKADWTFFLRLLPHNTKLIWMKTCKGKGRSCSNPAETLRPETRPPRSSAAATASSIERGRIRARSPPESRSS